MSFGERTGDLVSSAVAMLLGAFYLVMALRLPFWTEGGNPGAGFLPTVLGVGMISLSLLLAAKTLREHPLSNRAGGDFDQGTVSRPLFVLMALVGYVFLFPILGYLLTSVVLIWFLLWVFDPSLSSRRKAANATVVSISVVALFYVVFVRLLELQVPIWPFDS